MGYRQDLDPILWSPSCRAECRSLRQVSGGTADRLISRGLGPHHGLTKFLADTIGPIHLERVSTTEFTRYFFPAVLAYISQDYYVPRVLTKFARFLANGAGLDPGKQERMPLHLGNFSLTSSPTLRALESEVNNPQE